MKSETATIIIFAIITLLLMPIWAPLAMAYINEHEPNLDSRNIKPAHIWL